LSTIQSISEHTGQLANSFDEIRTIVDTIEAIAKKTNLLALNASIEASRAGAAGLGFTVVAKEVKDLSHQTASATEQVRGNIAKLRRDVQATVKATNEGCRKMSEGEAAVRAARISMPRSGKT
jgi:methyl-accepting chemotaxis protein